MVLVSASSVCLSLPVCLAASALHTSFSLLHLSNIPSVFMVNGTECQVYLQGKLKFFMVNSEHTAESDDIFTFWSVLNFQMKKHLNVAFKFSDVSIFL